MRLIYSSLLYIVALIIPFYLKKRGKKNPQYLENWNERFGINLVNPCEKPIIWFHAVSVGETRAMQKLVELTNYNLPEYQILITTMTPTGRETAKQLYPFAYVHYIPYDLSFSVKQFYKTFKPKLGIIMETEIWPNLIHFAKVYSVPLYLVNARLSNRSFNGYNRFKIALMPILNELSGILCQDDNTYNNFKKLNFNGLLNIVGNTKFDLVVPNNILSLIDDFKLRFSGKKIISIASTRDGEEEIILKQLKFYPDMVYLIIPRHPERFDLLEQLLVDRKIKYQRRSDNSILQNNTQVIIGDSMGEMLAYYAISYLAVIGGSFKDFGGQNPIEAIFMKVPVIFGNSMYNFAEVAKNCLDLGCGRQTELNKLSTLLEQLLFNEGNVYNDMVNKCTDFIISYQGASLKIFNTVKEDL